MTRRDTQFTVNAESVQGNEGATATFQHITVGERLEYLADDEINDFIMVRRHLLSWSGIVDNDDRELPDPKDEPGVFDALYLPEMRALALIMWRGPDEADSKN